MTIKTATIDAFNQFMAFKDSLKLPQHKRQSWGTSDISYVQRAQYWLRSYLNGMELMKQQEVK